MARLWTSGFELNSATAGIEFDFTSGGVTIDSGTFRSGAFAGKVNLAGAAAYFQYQFNATSANGPFFARAYINISVLPSATTDIMWFQQTSGSFLHCAAIYITSSGALQLMNYDASGVASQVGSNSSALNTGQWYRIELKFDRSPAGGSQVLDGRIDGVSFASSSALTIGNAPGTFSVGGNGAGQTATGTWFYDDVALNDSTGSFQTSFPGSGKVIRLKPNAAGDVNTFATQTGGTAGSANNFTRVNEVTPDDATTFNGSSTLNQEDLFNVDNSGIGASDTVNVVEVHGRTRNSTADATAVLKFEIEKAAAGTKSQSAAVTPNATTWVTDTRTTPRTAPLVTYQDPDAGNWTQTTLDSMQVGYKLTTAPGTAGRRIDVTSVYALVDYTPAAITQDALTGFLPLMGVGA